jgi:hypothetical protein
VRVDLRGSGSQADGRRLANLNSLRVFCTSPFRETHMFGRFGRLTTRTATCSRLLVVLGLLVLLHGAGCSEGDSTASPNGEGGASVDGSSLDGPSGGPEGGAGEGGRVGADGFAPTGCANGNGGCDPLTVCTDTASGPSCGPCPAPFQGAGKTGCTCVSTGGAGFVRRAPPAVTNVARGASYTLEPRPNFGNCTDASGKNLTDGVYTSGFFWDQPTSRRLAAQTSRRLNQ